MAFKDALDLLIRKTKVYNPDSTNILKEQGYVISFRKLSGGNAAENTVSFKAFLTDIADEYTSEWNPEEIFGRMDPIVTFKGTSRKISISWDIVSYSKSDAEENLATVSKLLKMLYPEYDESGAIKTAPLFEVKFSNMIRDARSGTPIVGAIEGFTYKPDLNQGFFAVGETKELFAQTVNMSCNIVVLHTHQLGWKTGGGGERDGFEGFPYFRSTDGKDGGNGNGKAGVNDNANTAVDTEKRKAQLAEDDIFLKNRGIGA